MTAENTALVEAQVFGVQELKDKEVERLKKLAEEAKQALETPITDKLTLKLVHDTRIKLRDNRTKLNKDRKAFTAHLDEKKNAALSVEKELVGIISPIEDELLAKEEEYEKEQERIKEEKAKKEAEILQKRIEALNAVEAEYIVGQIAIMSDEGFDMLLEMHKKKYDQIVAERKRQEEEKKRQEEAEALRKQKEENDRIAEENRKEAERIQKENARIAEEQAQKARELAEKEKAIKDKEDEQKRQEELEKARKEGEEKARKEGEEKAEAERIEKEEKEKEEKARIARLESYKAWLATE